MKVVILLPRRLDNGHRDRLWAFCEQRWQENFPEWHITQGYHTAEEGPFNRSLAINRAAEAAGDWDVALIIDGDTVSDPGAVRRAVDHAYQTGALCIAHDRRVMMNERGTQQVLAGLPQESWGKKVHSSKTYYDSVSCAVAVSRQTWDLVGGFDERFVGWGFEDTAFHIAVETLTGLDRHVEKSTCYHLWHPVSPEASHLAPTFGRNHALKRRYEVAHWEPDRVRAVLNNQPDPGHGFGVIPRILWRTVPEQTSQQVEAWWDGFGVHNPTWDQRTVREPVNPADFPLTGHLFDKCVNGAQKAGLIRLELLVTHGGVYVDSDVESVRPIDALTWTPAFAGWEDERVVPDAILGSVPGHPAMRECLRRAAALIEGGSVDAWETGPGVTTAVLPWRDDVLLLPPGSLYPVHYKEKHNLGSRNQQPWVFMEHKWHHSWAPEKKRREMPPVRASKPVAPAIHVEPIEIPDFSLGICMPWRETSDQWRRDAFDWCYSWWASHGLQVYLGDGQSRSEMCNSAARKAIADGADVLVFADADTWADPSQVVAAAIKAYQENKLVHAFDVYCKLDGQATRMGLRSNRTNIKPQRYAGMASRKRDHVSGLSAINTTLWNLVGGFDERFIGWGFEDQAFHLACETLGGQVLRVEGYALHWYHKADPTKTHVPARFLIDLMQNYCTAAGYVPSYGRVGRLAAQGEISIDTSSPSVEHMQSLLSSDGGPLSRPVAVS